MDGQTERWADEDIFLCKTTTLFQERDETSQTKRKGKDGNKRSLKKNQDKKKEFEQASAPTTTSPFSRRRMGHDDDGELNCVLPCTSPPAIAYSFLILIVSSCCSHRWMTDRRRLLSRNSLPGSKSREDLFLSFAFLHVVELSLNRRRSCFLHSSYHDGEFLTPAPVVLLRLMLRFLTIYLYLRHRHSFLSCWMTTLLTEKMMRYAYITRSVPKRHSESPSGTNFFSRQPLESHLQSPPPSLFLSYPNPTNTSHILLLLP